MLRRIPRLLRVSIVVAVLLAVSASVYQTWTTGNAGLGTTQTAFGPLTVQDRNLLIAVRQAGLWEGPVSEQAQQMASSAEVKEVGGKLAAEHAELDAEVRRVADQLGVIIPAAASTTQQAWMNQIAAQTGADYDRTYVQIVREAHGTVLPIINDVRVSTRNDLIRQFAETSDAFVTRHCQYLESTGMVDYSRLPVTQVSAMTLLSNGTGPGGLILPIVVFVAVLLGVVAMLASLRKKKAQQSERVTVTKTPPVAPTMTAAAASIPALTPVAALTAGSGSGRSADRAPSYPMDTGYPAEAPIPVGAFAGADSRVGATSGIPSPRAGGEPSVQWTMGGPGLRDTGPHPTIDAAGPYAPVSDSGAYRINSGAAPVDGYAGGYPGGGYAAGPGGSGGYPAAQENTTMFRQQNYEAGGYQTGYDPGGFPSSTGRYRTVSETGSHRPEDTGSRRSASDTGSHRAHSGPRHSTRR